MVIFNSYVKLPEGIPYITGLLHGSNLKVHPSRNQWKEWGTRFSGIGANLWCKSRSIYESNICIYIDIFTCLVSYTDGFYLHLIYIYIIFTCVQFLSLSLYIYTYIYIHIYIWFQISLEPSAGQMTLPFLATLGLQFQTALTMLFPLGCSQQWPDQRFWGLGGSQVQNSVGPRLSDWHLRCHQ